MEIRINSVIDAYINRDMGVVKVVVEDIVASVDATGASVSVVVEYCNIRRTVGIHTLYRWAEIARESFS